MSVQVATPDQEILVAASRCSRLRAEAALARGADVNARSATGQTPLIRAVSRGRERGVELIAWLLERGADPDLADRMERTALHAAAMKDAVQAARRLLDGGAAPDLPDRRGRTPLWYAVGARSLSMSRLLLERGANPDHRPPAQWSCLEYALNPPVDLELVRCLLDAGADPDLPRDPAPPALLYPLLQGDLEAVRLLLDHGARPNASTPAPSSIYLYHAISRGHHAIIHELLDRGADPDLPAGKLTPLTLAASLGDGVSVQTLLERGADPELPNGLGMTPLGAAVSEGRSDVAELLRKAGA